MFILFMYDKWYPQGGTTDIRGYYDSLEDALKAVISNPRWDCYDVLDTQTRTSAQRGSVVGLLSSRQEPGSCDD